MDRGLIHVCVHTADHHAVPFPAEPNAVDPAKMSTPSAQRSRRRHVPQEDLLVPAHAREPRIVVGDGEIENLVAVGRIALDQTGLGDRRVGLGRVVEMDGAIRGAGEQLGSNNALTPSFTPPPCMRVRLREF